MNQQLNPEKVHAPLGAYSHTIAVPANARWLTVAGQVGVSPSGNTAKGIGKQAEQAFRNVLACLRANDMGKQDLVKFNIYLTDSRFIPDYRAAREKVIGNDTAPAATLLIVAGLATPDLLIEVEAWAAQG